MTDADVLKVSGLGGGFVSKGGGLHSVLRDVSFSIAKSSLTAVVGESGSGKSLTALAILGLSPAGFRTTCGQILFQGRDLLGCSEADMREMRGARISMVFQDARASLNPVFTVGTQISDVCRAHQSVNRKVARRLAEEALEQVGVPEPGRRMDQYPHEYSGGMAQRAMLAMALVCQPTLLLLDEPTTGLDVTIQSDIIDLVVNLNRSSGMTTCLITHDLGIVAESCDAVVVMQDGAVRETGSCEQILTNPQNSYTKQLIAASRLSSEGNTF